MPSPEMCLLSIIPMFIKTDHFDLNFMYLLAMGLVTVNVIGKFNIYINLLIQLLKYFNSYDICIKI